MKNIKSENGKISSKANIHESVIINCKELCIEDGVTLEEGVQLNGDYIYLSSKCFIGHRTTINSKHIHVGYKAVIQYGSTIKALTGTANKLTAGDFSFLGYNQNIVVSDFEMGDYTTIHNSCFITGYEPCILGHNCWVGQQSILNSSKKLSIGNNVGIGTGSQLWTHVIHGELLEGSTMYGEHPLTIEDDVWIVGGAVISPNLTLKKGSVIMVGSVLTKDTEEKHCYAGVPAVDITNKLKPYIEVTLNDKFEMMKKFTKEFHASNQSKFEGRVVFLESINEKTNIKLMDGIVIVKSGDLVPINNNSVFSLESKKYLKNRSEIEESFMRFHERFRAKFIPV